MTLNSSNNVTRKIKLEYEKLAPKVEKPSCLMSVYRYLSSIRLADSNKARKVEAAENEGINWELLFFRGIKD